MDLDLALNLNTGLRLSSPREMTDGSINSGVMSTGGGDPVVGREYDEFLRWLSDQSSKSLCERAPVRSATGVVGSIKWTRLHRSCNRVQATRFA